jgi:hypothetical protein
MLKHNIRPRHSGKANLAVLLALTALTAAAADYQTTVLTDTPLAYYPLDLNVDTGTTATDLSGNGNAGNYVTIDPYDNSVPGPSAFITNAISFDGFTTYVDLSAGSNPSLLNFGGPITMEAWAQAANPNSSAIEDILGKGYDSANNYDEIALRLQGGHYEGVTYNGTSGTRGASGGAADANWTHLVSTFDGTNWSMYVNGRLTAQSADTVGSINYSTPWRIGGGTADGAGRMFVGNISQVALYSHSLTSAQVLTHYMVGQYGVTPETAVPVIAVQPQSQSNYVGGTVAFSVSALSLLPMTNQWFKNGSAISGQTNASLILTNVQSGDVANYSVRIGNSNGITNSDSAGFTLIGAGASLQWSANGNSGVWDAGSSANWINRANSQQTVFNTSDQVLFDDTANVPTNVSVSGTVMPYAISVDSSANNFTLQGSGSIGGQGSLTKSGNSALVLNVTGGFTGTATVAGGTLQTVGGNTLASVSSVTVSNGATLDFAGSYMTGNNSVTISGTGFGGEGALFNSGGGIYGNVLNVTLAGDATFGGSGRWDLGSGSQINGAHSLTMNWSGGAGYGEWNAVSVGATVTGITLTGGNFGVNNMTSGFQNPGTVFTVDTNCELMFWSGGWNGSFHVRSSGRVDLWTAPAPFNGSSIILDEGALWYSWGGGSGDQPINSAVTLNGVAHFLVGDHNLVYTNLISGPGGFVMDAWNHQLVFSAANTYSGPTIIGDGPQVALSGNGSISSSSLIFFGGNNPASVHVDVSGRSDKTLTLAGGQTLGGIGAIAGNLVVSAGATLAPAGTNSTIGVTTGANPTGTIAASNNVTLQGTTVLKLNGNGTNDMVQAGANLSYGGILNLANVSGVPLAAGDSFQVFSAANYSGAFASVIPAAAGAGLAWDLSQLNSGKVGVVVSGVPILGINRVGVFGGNLVFSGTNGAANGTYSVLTSTNVAAPMTNWSVLTNGTFDAGGAFSITNAVGTAPRQFFRIRVPGVL